ncbi:MAG: hypothetical protein KDC07_00975 [Chitinophagaceae bacterium]|nr:hypothetical protein [Chitinophagaceae bacterium]MCB9045814.1 hypothetical protein [Chitinophagales bacterium]
MKRLQLLTLIPSICFALTGAFDIGMDAWHGTLSWSHTLFNLAFFIPLVFRNRYVYLICGSLFTILWGYMLFAGIFLAATGRVSKVSALEMTGVSLFLAFSFVCAVAMLYAGIELGTVTRRQAQQAGQP